MYTGDAVESWIGLDKLHTITTTAAYGLKVKTLHHLVQQPFPQAVMTDWDGTDYTAVYDHFSVTNGRCQKVTSQ